MKQLLITIAAVVLVGCGESQQSAPAPEVEPTEPIAEAAKPELPPAKAPDISIHEAVKEGNVEAVKQHLDAGTYINSRNSGNEWTPLHVASFEGNKKIVELLVAEGADVDARDRLSDRPIHHAITYKYKDIVEFLISKSADVNAKNAAKYTPLHLAIRDDNKKVAELLIANGADVNAIDVIDSTPLDVAIEENHTEIAALLRKHGGKTGAELKAEGK